MAILLDLLDELLLDIVAGNQHEDLENLTLTCKRFLSVGKALLQIHRAKKKKYSRIVFGTALGGADGADAYVHQPMFLLSKISEDVTIAGYPTKMIVGHDEYSDVPLIPDCREAVTAALSQCTHIKVQYREYVIREIMAGKINASVALLLTMLPNLLSVEFYNNLSETFWETISVLYSIAGIDTCAGDYDSFDYDLSDDESSLSESSANDNTCIKSKNKSGSEDFFSLVPFMALPSVRSISGASIEGYWAQTWSYNFMSSVTEFTLTESSFDSKDLDVLIRHIAGLESFKFHFARIEDSILRWKPKAMVQSLIKYQRHSLQSLDLAGDDLGNEHYIGSLVELQKLKTIRVESLSFIEERECESRPPKQARLAYKNSIGRSLGAQVYRAEQVHRLVDVLPYFIKSLIMTDSHIKREVVMNLVEELAKRKDQNFPELKLLEFEGRVELPLEVEEDLEKAGIEVRHSVEDSYRSLLRSHEEHALD